MRPVRGAAPVEGKCQGFSEGKKIWLFFSFFSFQFTGSVYFIPCPYTLGGSKGNGVCIVVPAKRGRSQDTARQVRGMRKKMVVLPIFAWYSNERGCSRSGLFRKLLACQARPQSKTKSKGGRSLPSPASPRTSPSTRVYLTKVKKGNVFFH